MKKKVSGPILDLNSPKAVEEFREAVKSFSARLKTPQDSLAALVKAGIYTKSGKLAKAYRQ